MHVWNFLHKIAELGPEQYTNTGMSPIHKYSLNAITVQHKD